MKCPLCHDSGFLFAFMEGGVPPQCSCPIKSAGQVSLTISTPRPVAKPQHQAELPNRSELATAQAQ